MIVYKLLISDASPFYHLMGMASSCDFLPNFQSSDEINLGTCLAINPSEDAPNALFLFRMLNMAKRGDVNVTLEGSGFDCSPVNGVTMIGISNTGSPLPCKAFVGRLNSSRNITCNFSCSCPAGCVMFRVAVLDPTDKLICEFLA